MLTEHLNTQIFIQSKIRPVPCESSTNPTNQVIFCSGYNGNGTAHKTMPLLAISRLSYIKSGQQMRR